MSSSGKTNGGSYGLELIDCLHAVDRFHDDFQTRDARRGRPAGPLSGIPESSPHEYGDRERSAEPLIVFLNGFLGWECTRPRKK